MEQSNSRVYSSAAVSPSNYTLICTPYYSILTKYILFQVALALARRGGAKFEEESALSIRSSGEVKAGRTRVTGPGSLSCENVIHAVGMFTAFNLSSLFKLALIFFLVSHWRHECYVRGPSWV